MTQAMVATAKNREMAENFLSILDPAAHKFTFQFLGDSGGHAQVIHATLDEIWPLIELHNTPSKGIGVFVTINETDFNGRRNENIVRARALFVDADSADQVRNCRRVIDQLGAPPTMIVHTSTERAHIYWACDNLALGEFSACQAALIKMLGTDAAVKDAARVMRLPGTLHLKNPQEPQLVTLAKTVNLCRYDFRDLVKRLGLALAPTALPPLALPATLPPADPTLIAKWFGPNAVSCNEELGGGIGTNLGEIQSAVLAIPPAAISAESDWTRLAMGLAHEARSNNAQAEDLWKILDAASQGAPNYDHGDNRTRWDRYVRESIRAKPVTIATVFDIAKTHGWRGIAPEVTSPENTEVPGASSEAPARNKFTAIFARDFSSLPEPTYIVEGIIPDQGITLIYGPSLTFKSFIALDILASVAAGIPAFTKHATIAGDTVMAAGEAPFGLARKRLPAWATARGICVADLRFALIPTVPLLANGENIKAFITSIKSQGLQPKIIGIDTVARAMAGLDENDARTAGLAISAAEALIEEFACAVILMHHSGKDDSRGARGSSALFAGVDAVFKVTRPNGSDVVTLLCEKMKDADAPSSIQLKGEAIAGSLVLSPITVHEYVVASRANPPLSQGEVIKGLQAAGAINGIEVTTHQLAVRMAVAGKPSSIAAMEKRLCRGAKRHLAAFVVKGSGGRGNPLKWTFPTLNSPGPSNAPPAASTRP